MENAGWTGRLLRDGLRARLFIGRPCDRPGCASSTYPSMSFVHRFSDRSTTKRRTNEIDRSRHPPRLLPRSRSPRAVRSAHRAAIEMTPEALELFAGEPRENDQVALEVSGNAWEVARIIRPHVARVVVVSPADTGIRSARAKTDRLDARALAKLLAAGSLRSVWVPDDRTRAMRRRLQRRRKLLVVRTKAKNEIHAALMRRLVTKPRSQTSSASQGPAVARVARAARRGAGDRRGLPAPARLLRVRRSRRSRSGSQQRRCASPEIRRLMTVPGVNVICAATFMAAVGDIGRFGDRRKLVGYLGLDPKVRQSGLSQTSTRADLKAGLRLGATRPGRGQLERRQGTGPDALLLPAHPRSQGSPGRDRRHLAKARLPVLVPADPRGGLRLRAAVADRRRSCGASSSRPALRRERAAPASGRPTRRCERPSRRWRSTGRGRL